jgi:hypothetical protein
VSGWEADRVGIVDRLYFGAKTLEWICQVRYKVGQELYLLDVIYVSVDRHHLGRLGMHYRTYRFLLISTQSSMSRLGPPKLP